MEIAFTHRLRVRRSVNRITEYSLVFLCVLMLSACRAPATRDAASIQFTRIPKAEQGGEENDIIEGRVVGARPEQRLVLYAKSANMWWVQPLTSAPFTRIRPNQTWTNATHLGSEYAALLVEASYRPPDKTSDLPAVSREVGAVAVKAGAAISPSKLLTFSGYEWRVRNAPSNRGGLTSMYVPENAWIDKDGALHLRIAGAAPHWTCAEVALTRSLGYGTYVLVVRDTSKFEPATAFAVFTWDYAGSDANHREMDVEISRWGDLHSQNGQYVLQPYHVPQNVARFSAPPGRLVHSLNWQPGRVDFKTIQRASRQGTGRVVAEHEFSSGVPTPGIESLRMDFYVLPSEANPQRKEAEVVIEKFEYLP